MMRILSFVYGVVAYVIFLATFMYTIGFVGNMVVAKSIDSGVEEPFNQAFLINTILLGLFAIQHSVMARQGFKNWWTKIVSKPVERSTYVLITSMVLVLFFDQWRPITGVVWEIENPIGHLMLQCLFWIGWLVVLFSTFMIDHFDLFGLRQVYLHLRNKDYSAIEFKTPALYKYVRHPILLGFIIAFWATPRMTVGHLVFAIATTIYTLIAIQLEERDMIRMYGEVYKNYQQQVPMLLPLPKKSTFSRG